MIEEGRYRTRMDNLGSPSRTSVNLSGDVAVANRLGGVTKLYALPGDCVESNGMPGIQTSTGKNDVLAWGVEECVAWHTPFAYSTQRPVAWAPGTLNRATCQYENEMLWTAGGQNNVADSLEVVRLNGEDGTIDATVQMPDVPIGYFGAYGGAVNQQGDFWFVVYDTYDVPETYMVRVDAADLSYEMVAVPPAICPYGFTVDSAGRPWIGSFCSQSARYTPGSDTWDLFNALGYGIQEDAEGRMWMADYSLPGVREIDSDTLALGVQIQIPGASSPKGISIDFAGKVWVVDMFQSAFRVDPDTQTWDVYNQLNGPYTYSDMTGWGLSNVTFPPG
jgi:streptogramin lyase